MDTLLTKQEQYYLITRYQQTGDKDALEELIKRNQGLVRSIANRYFNIHKDRLQSVADRDDFISEGNIGLISCIQKFDTTKNVEFSSYATIWITQKCKRFVHSIYTPIKVPEGTFRKIMREKTLQTLGVDCIRSSTSEKIMNAAKKAMNVSSLNIKVNEEMGGGELIDMLYDSDDVDPALIFERKAEADLLQKAMDRYLSDREQYIVKQRNNWNRLMEKAKTLETLGEELDLTRERVRQIEKAAYRKLKRIGKEIEV